VFKIRSVVIALAISTALFAGACLGAITTFTGTFSGANESPPVASAGTGTTSVIYDSTAHTLTVNVTFSGLGTADTAAFIHCCIAPPGNAGVASTTPTFTGFPGGVTSGTYSHTFDLTLASSFNPAFVTASGGTAASAEAALAAGLAAGQASLNIHTTGSPGGEIRAFLVPLTSFETPTLTGLAIGLLAMLMAIASVLAIRRRRR
jgi:hypothetical protein